MTKIISAILSFHVTENIVWCTLDRNMQKTVNTGMVQYLCHFLRRRRKNIVKLCHQSLDIRSDKKLHTHAWAYECHQQQYDFLNCKKWHKQWYMHFFSTVQTVTWCSGSVSWTQETHSCFSFGWVTMISI